MCFSYTLNTSLENLEKRYDAERSNHRFDPIYYVSAFTYPTMPVITNENPDSISFFKWGLIPAWVKDDTKASEIKKFTLNARAETIFEKPSFMHSVIKRRCLIPATGFFEWQHRNNEKIPYYIFPHKDQIFSFAGIWECYINESENEVNTYSIITCDADGFMAEIHNSKKRMPIILGKEEESLWLKKDIDQKNIQQLIQPKETELEAYTISKAIGNPKLNSNNPKIYERYNYDNPTLGI